MNLKKGAACLLCFEKTNDGTIVSFDESARVLESCFAYLHDVIIHKSLRHIKPKQKTVLKLCQSCYGFTSELTHLKEQLDQFEKKISDLSILFSLSIFHRHSRTKESIKIKSPHEESKKIEIDLHGLSDHALSRILSNAKNNKNGKTEVPIKACKTVTKLDTFEEMGVIKEKEEINEDFDESLNSPEETEHGISDDREFIIPIKSTETKLDPKLVHVHDVTVNQVENVGEIDSKNQEPQGVSCVRRSVRTKLPNVRFKNFPDATRNSKTLAPKSSVRENSTDMKSFDKSKTCDAIKIDTAIGSDHSDSDSEESKETCIGNRNDDTTNKDCFKCEYCHQIYNEKYKLKSHRKSHPEETSLTCSICEKTFRNIANIRLHQLVHSGERPFKCSSCDKCFNDPSTLKSHERRHNTNRERKHKCSICEKSFMEHQTKTRHEQTHKATVFQCTICEKSYKNAISLKNHTRMHTGEMFQCGYCGTTCTELKSLQVHERVHTGETPYECSMCDKRFISTSARAKHVKGKHSTLPLVPYKCSFCTKTFTHLSNKRMHERIHTGYKPHKCSFCNMKFTSSTYLKRHRSVHTGERPYKCSFCDKKYSRMNSLKDHERTHTGDRPHKCSFCDKKFTRVNRLKEHERTHTGEKPYKCSYCAKLLSTQAQWKAHEDLHSGVQRYKCLQCDSTFSSLSSKKKHEATHNEIVHGVEIVELS